MAGPDARCTSLPSALCALRVAGVDVAAGARQDGRREARREGYRLLGGGALLLCSRAAPPHRSAARAYVASACLAAGRILNVSVSAADTREPPRLLNYLTGAPGA